MVLTFVFGYLVSGRAGGIHPGAHVATLWALAVEVVCTMALVAVVLNVAATRATQGNAFYGLARGFTIVVAAFAGGPISGGTVNPAVGFGATLGAAVHWLQIRGRELAAEPPQRHPSPGAPAPVPEEP